MSKKSGKIASRIQHLIGGSQDPHYLGFFECFNRGEYYEAHDVLEELWLVCRKGPEDAFYKGLIQLAGAFVHYRKGRRQPGAALLKLAAANFQKYPPIHQDLDLGEIRQRIQRWLAAPSPDDYPYPPNPLDYEAPPQVGLGGGE